VNVTVGNTPLPVTVTNPTVPPSSVNIGNAAAIGVAFAQALRGVPVVFGLSNGVLGAPGETYSVPVGQRLVIEYVSGACPDPGSMTISTYTNGANTVYRVSSGGSVIQTTYYFDHAVKIFADQGTVVRLEFGEAGCRAAFSGQLVTP